MHFILRGGNFPKINLKFFLRLGCFFIMNENVKIFVGLLVPAATFVAFFFSVFLENYVLGMFLSIFGISSWLFFTFVVKAYWHQITGNVIIVFGALLAVSVFLDAGIEQNMFGGLDFQSKCIAYSTILLFFSVLLGVLFKNMAPNISTSNAQIISRDPVAFQKQHRLRRKKLWGRAGK